MVSSKWIVLTDDMRPKSDNAKVSSMVKGLIREQNSSLSSNSMIFLRIVGTIRSGCIKSYHTNLAVTSLCMAVSGIHDPQTCPNIDLKEIHSIMMTLMTHLTQVKG